ncbi:MAG TPA: response regulator, partial [Burkholderiales bacterium]
APGSARGRSIRSTLHGRVLVVDDEQAVGEYMRDLLESWGVDTVFVSGATQARTVFAADTQRFDMVITDQTMPRMTGLELARELVAMREDLPVVLYTGFNDGIAKSQLDESAICAVINKPVDPQTLFALLRNYLPATSRHS